MYIYTLYIYTVYIRTSRDCLVILPCSLVKTLTVSRNSMKRHSTEYDMFKNMFKY